MLYSVLVRLTEWVREPDGSRHPAVFGHTVTKIKDAKEYIDRLYWNHGFNFGFIWKEKLEGDPIYKMDFKRVRYDGDWMLRLSTFPITDKADKFEAQILRDEFTMKYNYEHMKWLTLPDDFELAKEERDKILRT